MYFDIINNVAAICNYAPNFGRKRKKPIFLIQFIDPSMLTKRDFLCRNELSMHKTIEKATAFHDFPKSSKSAHPI